MKGVSPRCPSLPPPAEAKVDFVTPRFQRDVLIKGGATPQACISDFGSSTLTPAASFAIPASTNENRGTYFVHIAPELLLPEKFGLRDGQVSKQADVYAFGMVVYEVLTGCCPFGDDCRWLEVTWRIIEGMRPSKPENTEDTRFGRGTWELVQQCWDGNRDKRPTVEDICNHFRRVARTSTVIPPGSISLGRGTDAPTLSRSSGSEPDHRSGDFRKCLSRSMCTGLVLTARRRQLNYSPPLKQAQAEFSGSGLLQISWRVVNCGEA